MTLIRPVCDEPGCQAEATNVLAAGLGGFEAFYCDEHAQDPHLLCRTLVSGEPLDLGVVVRNPEYQCKHRWIHTPERDWVSLGGGHRAEMVFYCQRCLETATRIVERGKTL